MCICSPQCLYSVPQGSNGFKLPKVQYKHVWIALLGGTSTPTKAFMIVHCTTRNSQLLKGYAGRGKKSQVVKNKSFENFCKGFP